MQFRRRLQPNANVDLIPMIDVVFQLVVFFMVTSTFVMTPGIALDLPESSSAEPVVLNRLVVTVVSPQEIYLNRDRVTLDSLEQALAAESAVDDAEATGAAGRVKSVVLEGDRAVSYELLVQVLDALRRHGYRGVALRTTSDEE